VWSDRLGLIGKCDVVEFIPTGISFRLEYKHGKKREKIHDDLSLPAQAMCLEEMTARPSRMADLSPRFAAQTRGGNTQEIARQGGRDCERHSRHDGFRQAATSGQ